MRQAAKRDGNEKDIIKALEAVGAKTVRLSAEGLPDLLVAYRGLNWLIEVKDKRGKLTDDQVKFHASWPAQVAVVKNAEDALRAIGANFPTKYPDGNEHMTPARYQNFLLRERAGLK